MEEVEVGQSLVRSSKIVGRCGRNLGFVPRLYFDRYHLSWPPLLLLGLPSSLYDMVAVSNILTTTFAHFGLSMIPERRRSQVKSSRVAHRIARRVRLNADRVCFRHLDGPLADLSNPTICMKMMGKKAGPLLHSGWRESLETHHGSIEERYDESLPLIPLHCTVPSLQNRACGHRSASL